jgi:arylsulfatase A-like enzyme
MKTVFTLGMLVAAFASISATSQASAAEKPNIVVVLFDDLGYGQPPNYRAESEFKLPNLARLCDEGMRFTDAHSAAAVCTPTRYGLLTGRYPSRIGQYGVLTTFSPPLIPKERATIASLLKQQGYHTACIGKWHLGMNWVDGKPGKESEVPLGAKMTGGPNAVGFDYFYGFTHARNIGTIIEQDRVVEHVQPVENQPRMIHKALSYLEERAKEGGPFFLYFPMCPPHTPVVPAAEYIGKSGAKDLVGKDAKYGDWVYQGDDMLGQILAALDRLKLADNTLVIATSDNGAEHRAYAPLRESKRSIYEGGHRVPFVARWPGHVKPGTTSDITICLNDIFATAAEIVGAKVPEDAAEDSISLLSEFTHASSGVPRAGIIHQSAAGDLAIRLDEWKLVFLKNGQRELYNLQSDLSEKHDVAADNPQVVAQLTKLMQQNIEWGRSNAGPAQKNDKPISLEKGDTNKVRKKKRAAKAIND